MFGFLLAKNLENLALRIAASLVLEQVVELEGLFLAISTNFEKFALSNSMA